jgi:hypothetical protein
MIPILGFMNNGREDF